jgi:hypothetical protein
VDLSQWKFRHDAESVKRKPGFSHIKVAKARFCPFQREIQNYLLNNV